MVCSAVYTSPKVEFRHQLWEYLENLGGCIGLPWLLMGDKNQVLLSSYKVEGREVNKRQSMAFWNVIDACNLIDMGFSSPMFTWLKKITGNRLIMERLDRSLCSPQ